MIFPGSVESSLFPVCFALFRCTLSHLPHSILSEAVSFGMLYMGKFSSKPMRNVLLEVSAECMPPFAMHIQTLTLLIVCKHVRMRYVEKYKNQGCIEISEYSDLLCFVDSNIFMDEELFGISFIFICKPSLPERSLYAHWKP